MDSNSYEDFPVTGTTLKISAARTIVLGAFENGTEKRVAGQMYAAKHDELCSQGYKRHAVISVSEEDAMKQGLAGTSFSIDDVVVPANHSLQEYPIEGLRIVYVMPNGKN